VGKADGGIEDTVRNTETETTLSIYTDNLIGGYIDRVDKTK